MLSAVLALALPALAATSHAAQVEVFPFHSSNVSCYRIPLLVPGVMLRLDAELECIDENGGADAIRVFVCNAQSSLPVLSAIVNMPVSEMLLQQN